MRLDAMTVSITFFMALLVVVTTLYDIGIGEAGTSAAAAGLALSYSVQVGYTSNRIKYR